MPSKRELARRLQTVRGFENPDPELEQYSTPADIAATLVHTAALQGDVVDCPVIDLGCGTGMLALASAQAGSARVVGLDVDPTALDIARANEHRLELDTAVSWVLGDVTHLPFRPAVDDLTVVMNPPFGAQSGNRHADRAFLDAASAIATVSYSIHNTGSAEFVESYAADHDAEVTHAYEAEFELPHSFEFHSEASRTIDVEVFRIRW